MSNQAKVNPVNTLKRLAIGMLLLAVLPTSGLSEEANKRELNPWVDCGVGALVFDETGWAAVSYNLIWDLGTTAVISDKSSQETCGSKKAQTAHFIRVNYASLTEEAAKGEGKHLHAMLDVIGCKPASRAAVISSVRSGLGQHLSSADYVLKNPAAKAEDFYRLVHASVRSEQCII